MPIRTRMHYKTHFVSARRRTTCTTATTIKNRQYSTVKQGYWNSLVFSSVLFFLLYTKVLTTNYADLISDSQCRVRDCIKICRGRNHLESVSDANPRRKGALVVINFIMCVRQTPDDLRIVWRTRSIHDHTRHRRFYARTLWHRRRHLNRTKV